MTIDVDAKRPKQTGPGDNGDGTQVGNYFIANYPPFSFWKKELVPAIEQAFDAPATPGAVGVPLGLYMHIPFCRKRCKFCYFRVYTDVNAHAIEDYVDALTKEIELVANRPAVRDRPLGFAYFGGGTPSYLSARQLQTMAERLRRHVSWDQAGEVTFECEPGTLHESKIKTLREIGVTRLSLGVENFSDAILEENGRAHLSAEIYRAWEWIRNAGFDQTNIDLIAGMVGETTENWRENIRRTIELDPDSVTIYQMELPYNTRFTHELTVLGQQVDFAPWSVKRGWLNEAFDRLLDAGYEISSAYTMVKRRGDRQSNFLYRDALWQGADLLGTGVASFGHLAGVHYQNIDGLENYQSMLAAGRLPLGRALPIGPKERLIREVVLQMKVGRLDAGYFRRKFGAEIFDEFSGPFSRIVDSGKGEISGDRFTLTREGLLRVDSLLPAFFLPEHRTDRYT